MSEINQNMKEKNIETKRIKKEKKKFIYPNEWGKIVAKYPNKFCPRMILRKEYSLYGNYTWQASENKQIDISNWKLFWTVDGREVLLTIDELDKYHQTKNKDEQIEQEPDQIREALFKSKN